MSICLLASLAIGFSIPQFFTEATSSLMAGHPSQTRTIAAEAAAVGGSGGPTTTYMSFSQPVKLSNDERSALFPRVATSTSHVYVVWTGEGVNNWQTNFRKSDDRGTNFGPTRIFTESGKSYFYPDIAAIGRDVYLAWLTDSAEPAQPLAISFKASHNYGKEFDPTIQLQVRPPDKPGNVTHPFDTTEPPKIAATKDDVYVAWFDAWDLFIRASHDHGTTFAPTRTIITYPHEDDLPGDDQVGTISIAAEGKSVYLAWHGHMSGNIYLRASNDGGRTFGPIMNLSNNPQGTSSESPLVIAGAKNNAYVSWVTFSSSPGQAPQAMFSSSNDKGKTFAQPTILGDIYPSSASTPNLAAHGRDVFVVWGGSFDKALFRASHDKGRSFDPVIGLNNQESGSVSLPQLSVAKGKLYAAWLIEETNEDGTSSDHTDVRASTDGGRTFGPIITAPSQITGPHLVLASSASRIYLVSGGSEVFFVHS